MKHVRQLVQKIAVGQDGGNPFSDKAGVIKWKKAS